MPASLRSRSCSSRVVLLAATSLLSCWLLSAQNPLLAQSFDCSIEDQTVLHDAETGEGSFTATVDVIEDADAPEYPTDIHGIMLLVENEAEYLAPVGATAAGAVAELNGGSGPEFFDSYVTTKGDTTVVEILMFFTFDYSAGLTLAGPVCEIDYELEGDAVLAWEKEAGAGVELLTPIDFVVADPSDPFGERGSAVLTVDEDPVFGGVVLVPVDTTFDGAAITILPDESAPPPPPPPPANLFLRGDVNGNGAVSALGDALYLLQWGFGGGDEPACLDAADVDDNDSVSVLADCIALLKWAFSGGPEPAAPGPTECGADPEADAEVTCLTPPDVCND